MLPPVPVSSARPPLLPLAAEAREEGGRPGPGPGIEGPGKLGFAGRDAATGVGRSGGSRAGGPMTKSGDRLGFGGAWEGVGSWRGRSRRRRAPPMAPPSIASRRAPMRRCGGSHRRRRRMVQKARERGVLYSGLFSQKSLNLRSFIHFGPKFGNLSKRCTGSKFLYRFQALLPVFLLEVNNKHNYKFYFISIY